MDPRHYLMIRRSYNNLRHSHNKDLHLTFEEFVILSLLYQSSMMTATQLSDFQGVSRPTMTHRGNHLSEQGLIHRIPGMSDRRQVCCSLTDRGKTLNDEICMMLAAEISDDVLSPEFGVNRIERMRTLIIGMGAYEISATNFTLLAFSEIENIAIISDIVEITGLLQPTVSMSVARLHREEKLERVVTPGMSKRISQVRLTDAGKELCAEICKDIEGLQVPAEVHRARM